MKACGYCGRENDDQSALCLECGTLLTPINDESNQTALAPTEHRLDARYATFILFLYLGVQFGVGVVVGIATIAIAGVHTENSERAQLTRTITGPATVLSVIGGGVAILLTSLAKIRQHLSNRSPTGAAWVVGSLKHTAQGLGVGALTGCCYCALAIVIQRPSDDTALGPIATMAVTPGLPQLLWLFLALVLAPLVEEPLFRGMLYGGYRCSFGPVRAAILTTVIFSLLHITEIIYFLPSIIGILALAIAALWIRLRSSAIGPAVAVHFGYNAVLAITVIYSTLR
jgi:membrane protease YdiL (CAAX protease family)